MNTLSLKRLSWYCNFVLLFLIVLDPTNTIFHLKDIAFVLFLITSIPFCSCKYYFVPLLFLSVYFLSFSFGLFTSQDIDFKIALQILKSFVFFVYMLWSPCGYLETFHKLFIVSIIMAIIEIAIYVICMYIPLAEVAVYAFMQSHDNTIMMSHRDFYGVRVFSVFYKTSPILVIPLSFALVNFFKRKTLKDLFCSFIFCMALFMSGTRANMFSCALIVFAVFIFYQFFVRKRMFIVSVLFCIFSLAFLFATVFLLTTHETSTDMKVGHFGAFMQLFSQAPVQYTLIGAGPGARMYTPGFGFVTAVTELTYLEFVKNYGLVQTILIIALFLLPLLNYANNRNYDMFSKASLMIGYIAYLFIGGTNPLLVSSTGVMVFTISMSMSAGNIFLQKTSTKHGKMKMMKYILQGCLLTS